MVRSVLLASSFAIVSACNGAVVSLAGAQPGTGDGGVAGFVTADADLLKATDRACPEGEQHPNLCCRLGDGLLACGEWTVTPFFDCPTAYAEYADPVTCCTGAGVCGPGIAETGDSGALSVLDASSEE